MAECRGYGGAMWRIAVWLAWFSGLLVLWLVFVGTVQDVERTAGLFAAAIGATAAEVVRSQGLLRFRVEWRWVRRAGKTLLLVPRDFVVVSAALARRRRGSFRELEFPLGGSRAIDAGRRAFAVVVPSLAPNRLVVDADECADSVLVHDLAPGKAPSELL
jgi:hypothetical protein